MPNNFEDLNKKIASFMLVSCALASPLSASAVGEPQTNLIADANIIMPVGNIGHEIISMYAAPQIPIIRPLPPETPIIQPPPQIMKYAAPQMPQIKETDIQKIESHQTFNDTTMNHARMQNMENIESHVNKSMNFGSMNTVNNGFVTTEFGNVMIIEPYAHMIFR